MPVRSWTQSQLQKATEESKTITEIVVKLGLKYNPQTHRYIRDWILKYQIPTAHLRVDVSLGIKHNERSWTDEQLIEAIKNSASVKEATTKLGLSPTGGNYIHVKKHCERLGLAIPYNQQFLFKKKRDLQDLLQDNIEVDSYQLKIKLLKAKILIEVCKICNLGPIWNGQKLNLQLDHTNGNRKDCRLENLRLLCPNCHSQTDTFGNSTSHRERSSIANRINKLG